MKWIMYRSADICHMKFCHVNGQIKIVTKNCWWVCRFTSGRYRFILSVFDRRKIFYQTWGILCQVFRKVCEMSLWLRGSVLDDSFFKHCSRQWKSELVRINPSGAFWCCIVHIAIKWLLIRFLTGVHCWTVECRVKNKIILEALAIQASDVQIILAQIHLHSPNPPSC